MIETGKRSRVIVPEIDSPGRSEEEAGHDPFDAIVRQYIGFVRKLVYEIVLDENDADDVTQEVFVRAYRALPKFRRKAKFSTWLYRIAVNTAKSFLRKKLRDPVSSLDGVPEISVRAIYQPGFQPFAPDTHEAVSEALRSLPLKLRSAIVLTAIEGMSYEEAARIEGCLKATLYWRVHQARKMLREKLREYL